MIIRLIVCRIARALLLLGPLASDAQVTLPPVNLGGTSFTDGVAGPGWLLQPIVYERYHATRLVGTSGMSLPGENSFDIQSNLFHIAYITTRHLLGGFYGIEALLPVASLDVALSGQVARQSGVGDALVSPLMIEWPGRTLFGRQSFSRATVLVRLPTGNYSANRAVNVGSNAWGATAYYAFTVFVQPRLETSVRAQWLWNGSNPEPFQLLNAASARAGQALHVNYAMSYGVTDALRLGINGYALQQVTDHRVGPSPLADSKERVVALGPGVALSGGFWRVVGNVDFEFATRNRPEGQRINVTVQRVIPHGGGK